MTSRPDFATLLQLPILQAPTGSIAGPELAAAVSAAGGIGALALTWTSPDVADAHIESIRSKTDRPFLVNFALAFPPRSLEAALSARVPVVTFSWGDPSQYLEQVHAAGALCGVQVTSALGAERYADLGFDFLICQGSEAGGHVQANRSLWDLLPEVVGAAAGCPVVAAGGIGNGYDIARALSSSMGAVGAMLGTRFVATVESRAHTEYREQGSTRYAELHLVDQHVNQRSLVVGMTRHTHRYGMHYSAEAVGSFENLVQFGERSRDKISLDAFSIRDLAAEQRETQKQAQLRAAIEREREAAAERKAERERNADMAFYIELKLHERGVRTISREDILKIMPEVRAAASKIPYGSQTEIMAKIVQEKLAPKQSRGMRR